MKLGAKLLLAAALAVGLLAVGCGGDDASESGSDSPEDTVSSFFAAADDGDGARACDLMTEDSVSALELGGGDCADVMSEDSGDLPDDFEVGDVEEDGDTATVTVTGDGDEVDVPLKKEGDEWKIDFIGLGLSQSGGDASVPDDVTVPEDLTTP